MSTVEASTMDTKTPAQLLAEQHGQQEHHEHHNPTVEEVPDEDDIQHPPPAVNHPQHTASQGTNGVMSEKAAGKQKASDKPAVVDTQDEEQFPSLSATTKPSTQTPGWGAGTGPKLDRSSGPSPVSKVSSPLTTSTRPAVSAGNLPNTNRDHFDVEVGDINPSKSIQKVLADAKRKYRVNTGVQEIGMGKARRFYAEGPQKKEVRDALMDISRAITVERVVQIPVPAVASPTLIGKGGANIRKLEQDHGVKIQIKRDQRPASTDPDDPRIDLVEVRGDAAATRVVNSKIAAMVKEKQPTIDMPMRNVPPEFYPFLAGRHEQDIQRLRDEHDLEINIPPYHIWQAQPPPQPTSDTRPAFVPHGDSHIVVSGDQEAATKARREIEQLVRQLEDELTLEEYTADQVLHPYLIGGQRGMDPQEFMRQTGCALVLPPGSHRTDDLHIIGPADKIPAARDLADKLISSQYNRQLDLGNHYANAKMGADRHARGLAQYLQQRGIEREFRENHKSEVVFPTHRDAGPSWSVISEDAQKAVAAKNDLTKITQAFPTSRIQLVDVDPFYHPHMADRYQQKLQDEYNVLMIVPEDGSDPVVLVYEGPQMDTRSPLPRQRPTSPEVKQFEQTLAAAEAMLMAEIVAGEVPSRSIDVPRKHHDRLRRHIKNENLGQAGGFPVQIDYGMLRSRQTKAQNQTPESISLRGPDEAALDDLIRNITAFMVEAEQDEKERGYTTEIAFPEKYIKNLVGKNGANIKALRDKHDVEIDSRENGKVKIQGPQKKADACKAEIAKLLKQYEDEVSYTIKVDSQFHGELIGRGGENLTKLQKKVDNAVRIDFPRTTRSGADTPDNAGDIGGASVRQAADEIKIRGPKAKADKVREELLDLAQYLKDNSQTATIDVDQRQIRSIIGKAGAELEKLRAESGAQIDIPNDAPAGARVPITIRGTAEAVKKAKADIAAKSKAFDSVVTRQISVGREHHRELIGPKGTNIQQIVRTAGGPDRSAEAVQFPKQDEASSETLTLRGTKEVVDKIEAAINAFVEERSSRTTDTLEVPVEQHRVLIGPNGSNRRELEEKFKVNLDVPRRDSGRTEVKISGKADAVAEAKAHIQKLTVQPEGQTVMVPRGLHHTISNDGRLFRDLSRSGIKVEHKGHRPPPKSSSMNSGGAARRSNNTAAPLITDDPADTASHSFDVVLLGGLSDESGEIPWVLIPSQNVQEAQLAEAQRQIEAAIAAASEPRHCGYLRLADPNLHRRIIGQNGKTINRIRKESGCDIQVPGGARSQNNGDEITILGPEEGVILAKDMILDILNGLDS